MKTCELSRLSRQISQSSSRDGRRVRRSRQSLYLEALEPRQLMSVVAWTGGGSDGKWNTANNWVDESTSQSKIPSSDDDVLFPAACVSGYGSGSIYVGLDTDVEVASITIGAGESITLQRTNPYDSLKLTCDGHIAILAEDGANTSLNLQGGGEGGVWFAVTAPMILSFGPATGNSQPTTYLNANFSTVDGSFMSITSDTASGQALSDLTKTLTPSGTMSTLTFTSAAAGGFYTGTSTSSVSAALAVAAGSTGSGPGTSITLWGGSMLRAPIMTGILGIDMNEEATLIASWVNVPASFDITHSFGGLPVIKVDNINVDTRNLSMQSFVGMDCKGLGEWTYEWPLGGNERYWTTSAYVNWMREYSYSVTDIWAPDKTVFYTKFFANVANNPLYNYLKVNGVVNPWTTVNGSASVNGAINLNNRQDHLSCCVGCWEGGAWSSKLDLGSTNTVVLAGDIGDFLRCTYFGNGATDPNNENEEYCVLHAGGGITGNFVDGGCFDGLSIGLTYGYGWSVDIRNSGTELWIVRHDAS